MDTMMSDKGATQETQELEWHESEGGPEWTCDDLPYSGDRKRAYLLIVFSYEARRFEWYLYDKASYPLFGANMAKKSLYYGTAPYRDIAQRAVEQCYWAIRPE